MFFPFLFNCPFPCVRFSFPVPFLFFLFPFTFLVSFSFLFPFPFRFLFLFLSCSYFFSCPFPFLFLSFSFPFLSSLSPTITHEMSLWTIEFKWGISIGKVPSLSFLHFLKTNVQPIHVLVSASFDGCSM